MKSRLPNIPPSKLNLTALFKYFPDEDAARDFLEAWRWPNGAICPHCKSTEAYKIVPVRTERYQDSKGKWRTPRKGLWKCAKCRKGFSVTVGTIFERSHVSLDKWLIAIYLMCSSKKGISAHQIHRMFGIKYQTAWFLNHRIRFALTQEPMKGMLGGIVECDETYVGGRIRVGKRPLVPGLRKPGRTSHTANKAAVFSMVERGGKVYSRHVERVTSETLKPVIEEAIAEDAHMMTDTSTVLRNLGKNRRHSLVNHTASEYVRYDEGVCITTNSVEGYFATLKRGINGVYHHVGRKHLHRYLSEFDYRYNTRKVSDGERTLEALDGFEGRRLMYRDPIKGLTGQSSDD